jgi:AcrR family transcriptional regulator
MSAPKPRRSEDKRRQIIQAALACFTEQGYEQTSMARIRARSRASTGSIYHHFHSKEQLGAAVYLEGIQDWQAGFVAALERHAGAKAGVMAIVRFHLDWVRANPAWARYLFQMRHLEFISSVEADIQRINERFFAQVSVWFRRHIAAGRLKKLPKELVGSILMGPSQDYAKQLLAGPCPLVPARAARVLGEAAWDALKAK